MNYMENVSKEIKEYFNILEPNYPEWLNEYINTKTMQKQRYISVNCGKTYSKMHNDEKSYNSLDHSIGVALIIWHFTHNKKQTLSGLFHDIATPVFKHSIDFMNGDYMTQESTEDLTSILIKNSDEIMSLLKRDGIELSEVDDYHKYSIADNNAPQLSSDRLEYSLSNGHFVYNDISLEDIKELYNDLEIQKDEKCRDEIAFKTKELAEKFVERTSYYSIKYRDAKTRYSMQLIADIVKIMNQQGLLTKKDLYTLKESEVVDLIKKCKYNDIGKKYELWQNSSEINISKEEPKDVYYVHHGAKVRYIDPLCNGTRISDISKKAKEDIQNNLNYDMNDYMYLDFELFQNKDKNANRGDER